MSHKCIYCKHIWVNDDRQWCISCEKLFANGIVGIYGSEENGEEASGSPDDSGDETSEQ